MCTQNRKVYVCTSMCVFVNLTACVRLDISVGDSVCILCVYDPNSLLFLDDTHRQP